MPSKINQKKGSNLARVVMSQSTLSRKLYWKRLSDKREFNWKEILISKSSWTMVVSALFWMISLIRRTWSRWSSILFTKSRSLQGNFTNVKVKCLKSCLRLWMQWIMKGHKSSSWRGGTLICLRLLLVARRKKGWSGWDFVRSVTVSANLKMWQSLKQKHITNVWNPSLKWLTGGITPRLEACIIAHQHRSSPPTWIVTRTSQKPFWISSHEFSKTTWTTNWMWH